MTSSPPQHTHTHTRRFTTTQVDHLSACRGCGTGEQLNTSKTGCANCLDGKFSSGEDTACNPCAAGKQSLADGAGRLYGCVPCSEGKVSSDGSRCRHCPSSQMPNKARTGCLYCNTNEYYAVLQGQPQCVRCEPPLDVSASKDGCVCGLGQYNASVTTLRCVDDMFRGGGAIAPKRECVECPPCIDCSVRGARRVGGSIQLRRHYMLAKPYAHSQRTARQPALVQFVFSDMTRFVSRHRGTCSSVQRKEEQARFLHCTLCDAPHVSYAADQHLQVR